MTYSLTNLLDRHLNIDMLLITRIILVIIYCTIVCVFGSIYCLFSLRNPRHVSTFSHIFGRLSKLFGLKIEIRKPVTAYSFSNAIYISNHQNNYDMITVSNIVQPYTVTIGKKSLLWIPLFGQLYWLTGNILVDRNNRFQSYYSISKIINFFNKKRKISIWMFPEGTRNYGRGVLPFKSGAFHIAIKSQVPIIPICVSNTSNKVNLNRLNNGLVIIEMLSPIDVTRYKIHQIRELADYCRELMIKKINDLDKEVKERELSRMI